MRSPSEHPQSLLDPLENRNVSIKWLEGGLTNRNINLQCLQNIAEEPSFLYT